MNKKLSSLLFLGFCTTSLAQSSFSYSFDAADGTPWPADWSGATFADEKHHANGWGFDDPGSATDNYTGAYIGDQFVNVTGAKYYNAGSYDINRSSLNYTMGWNPNGQKGFIGENISSTGNQIFQIGVFGSTPGTRAGGPIQFGANLNTNPGTTPTTVGTAVAGHDSLYLAGVEISASATTQIGSLDLKYYDENSVELANFGTLNYTAVDAAGAHIFNFRQDMVDMGSGNMQITLTMDEYIVNPSASTTTFVGQTSFGTQTFQHGLNSLDTLTPGLGIRIQSNQNVSITAANYDGNVPVIVPEPSSVMLTLLGSMAFVLRRKR